MCLFCACVQELFEGYYFCQAQRGDFFQRARPYKGHPTIMRYMFSDTNWSLIIFRQLDIPILQSFDPLFQVQYDPVTVGIMRAFLFYVQDAENCKRVGSSDTSKFL